MGVINSLSREFVPDAPMIDVRDFGAKCDNTTDDSAALQSAINAFGDNANYRAGVLYVPGMCVISDTLLSERKALWLRGRNWGSPSAGSPSFGSGFRWNGTVNTKSMLRFRQTIGARVENLRFVGHTDVAKRPTAAISFFRGTGESQPNTMNRVEHCWFGQLMGYETSGRYLQNGILCEGVNENNDQSWFVDNVFHSCDIGINHTGTQNIINHIQECRFYENGIGVKTAFQTMITNCYFYASTDCDLDILGGNTFCFGFNSENSHRLARLRGYSCLDAVGEYFQYTNALAADGRIIDCVDDYRAHISLRKFDFRALGYTNPATPTISIKAANAGAAVHKVLELHDVTINQAPLSVSNLDVPVLGAAQDTVVFGEQQGAADASASGTQLSFWNVLKTGQATPSFTRDDRIATASVPPELFAADVGEFNISRAYGITGSTTATVTQWLFLTYFRARKTEAITKLRSISGSTAAGATPTRQQIGVYSVAANGDLTLITSIVNDTATRWRTAYTEYLDNLSATWNKAAGTWYAYGLLVVSTATMPNLVGGLTPSLGVLGVAFARAPRLTGLLTGQTTLPASVLAGNVGSGAIIQPLIEAVP